MTRVTVLLLWAIRNRNSDTDFEISAAICRRSRGNDGPPRCLCDFVFRRMLAGGDPAECHPPTPARGGLVTSHCSVWPCTPAHRA